MNGAVLKSNKRDKKEQIQKEGSGREFREKEIESKKKILSNSSVPPRVSLPFVYR